MPTKTKKKVSLAERLRRRGFDLAAYNPRTGYTRVECSQCEALCINGVACHEIGCPNERRAREENE